MTAAPRVLHVDNHVLALAKPAGMPCVPDESGDPSLFEWGKAWVAREYAKPGAVFLGVVHRLDRPVSGVVVFGRTSKGAARLTEVFRTRKAEKQYWAVVSGSPKPAAGEIRQHLWKDPRRNTSRVVAEETAGSKPAHTSYSTLDSRKDRAFVQLVPHTGRSHQLRVAMASLRTPILGDLRYGAAAALPDKSIALHAVTLRLAHPTTREMIDLVCPPPNAPVWNWPTCNSLREQAGGGSHW